jgi:hypothetical protein
MSLVRTVSNAERFWYGDRHYAVVLEVIYLR